MADPTYNYDLNAYSHIVDLSEYDCEGFLASYEDQHYELRRTNTDVEAYCNAGTEDLRLDWETYIGPVQEFGSRNDLDGHWCGLCLPLILPERHYLVAYIFEYAFYHDTILESVAAAVTSQNSEALFMDNTSSRSRRAILGAKQLQSKIFVGFLEGDKERVGRIVRTWEKMTSTTAKREKTEIFKDILEYEEYRRVDTGAFYVEAVMLWGMGLTLTPEEDEMLQEIRRPCYAALGLTNDYYSFDVEYDGYLKSNGVGSLTNAVWLYMQWEKCDVIRAKELTRLEVNRLEREFLRLKRDFERGPLGKNEKLVYYVRALAYQIPGNLIWSLKCPRYNVGYRDVGPLGDMTRPAGYGPDEVEAPAALPRQKTVTSVVPAKAESESGDSEPSGADSPALRPSSPASSRTSVDEEDGSSLSQDKIDCRTSTEDKDATTSSSAARKLADETLSFANTSPLEQQAKKVRDAIIDALSRWLDVTPEIVDTVKQASMLMHTASIRRNSDLCNVAILKSFGLVRSLPARSSVDIFMECMTDTANAELMHQHWRRTGSIPTETEYLDMIDATAGTPLKLIAQLLIANSTDLIRSEIFDILTSKLARLFTLLTDLSSYKAIKEGDMTAATKLSLPLVHALNITTSDRPLRQVYVASIESEGKSLSKKDLMQAVALTQPSLKYAMGLVGKLQTDLRGEVERLEGLLGAKNWPLRLILQRTAM